MNFVEFKGPYFARFGNLATAGAVSFMTKDHIEKNEIIFEQGQFNTNRLTTLVQITGSQQHDNAYIAGQYYKTNGPLKYNQDFQRFNLFGKFHVHLSQQSHLSVAVNAFSSAWNASGQIPQRAVDNNLISRFGAIDNNEGGTTGHQNINLIYNFPYKSNHLGQRTGTISIKISPITISAPTFPHKSEF